MGQGIKEWTKWNGRCGREPLKNFTWSILEYLDQIRLYTDKNVYQDGLLTFEKNALQY